MEFERKLILKEIKFLKESSCINILGSEPSCFEGKNSDKSIAVRKQANQLFTNKKHDSQVHEEIWKLYTKSIAYAFNESEELPAGYANRSALLLHLKKYSQCLLDIDRALKITDSNILKVKLYCRKSECCVALQDGKGKAALEKAKFWLSKIDNASERKKLKDIIGKTEKIILDDVPVLVKKEKDYKISCKNNAFRTEYNKKYGRHLVADRDIQMGELIYIDKFYVTTANSSKFYAYCSHCLALSWTTIPCDQCSFYMYCSENCKDQAWQNYHDIECSVKFGKHPKDHTDYYVQLGLRALVMGFKEIGGIEKLRELTNEIDKCKDLGKKGLNEDGSFSSDSFRSMYSLSCSKSTEKIKKCIPEILKIIVSLARNTQILGNDLKNINNIDLMKNENVLFIASLFLKLSSVSLVNAFEVTSCLWSCDKNDTVLDCMVECCCSRGLNLSLFTSLINHSCDNNVGKFYTNDGRVAYYALLPIDKNSQIFSSYYFHFFNVSKPMRQKLLSDLFEFNCDCVPCINNWPHFEDILPKNPIELLNCKFVTKHVKTLNKIYDLKKRRFSNETIRSFIQDTELLLKLYTRPNYEIEYFLMSLCSLFDKRYYIKLDVPSRCKNNSSK